jgi:superfamily I DNA/RNA helicase
MQEPSEEQQIIIDYVKEGYNILVRAVAGSGKSTTVLSLAKQLTEKNILQLAYNSSLRIDIKEKVSVLQLQNIKVHTFHSLAVKYYLPSASTDSGIRYILYNKLQPRQAIPKLDILVIDENQDLTELYFHFVVKFLCDMGSPIQLIVLGDELQCLYEFKDISRSYHHG